MSLGVYLPAPSDEDWCRSNVFHTYIKQNDKHYKVKIDGGRCVNIIAKSIVERMNLKVEPHPQSYITWVDKTAQFVSAYSVFELPGSHLV